MSKIFVSVLWGLFPNALPDLIESFQKGTTEKKFLEKIKLRYFNSRGRAEQIRLLLEDTGIE
jgi:hypothetical protein